MKKQQFINFLTKVIKNNIEDLERLPQIKDYIEGKIDMANFIIECMNDMLDEEEE